MNMFQTIWNRFKGDTDSRTQLGYDALSPKGRRKPVAHQVNREDNEIRGNKRDQLQATAAELARNLSLAAWMVRRHLDYVAMFQFRAMNESKALNDDLAGIMAEQARPNNADVAGRFNREKLFRLMETRRVEDGDTGAIKLDNLQMQGIQADLIKDPPLTGSQRPTSATRWIQGVKVNGQGRPLSFGIWRRKGYTGKEHQRNVQAPNMMFYGFWNRFAADQTRGISPMVAALAPMQDVYENFNYALAKAKLSQILAVAFYRDGNEALGEIENMYGGAGTSPEDIQPPKEYKVNFAGGPKVFNLDPGDRAEFLETKTAPAEFQSFTELVIQVSLKALDIPFSFYDESHTNFFGSRAAWLHYDRSCLDKRADQIELRRQYTVWQLAGAVRDRRLVLPRSMSLADLRWEWVPLGMPWWDPDKEIKGHESAMANALDTPQRICRATGSDFHENVDMIAEAKAYAESKGVDLRFATKPVSVSVGADAEDIEEETEPEDTDDDQAEAEEE